MANDLEGYAKAIEASLVDIEALNSKIELYAAQNARVALELRTFSTGGQGVKDVNGNKLSNYSPQYAKKRKAHGLQTANKDLIFSSDTSVIKDNITLGLAGGIAALGFIKEEGATIAGYQEEREKVKIFELNTAERDAVILKAQEFAIEQMRLIAQSWNK